jgi:hypothetical protein
MNPPAISPEGVIALIVIGIAVSIYFFPFIVASARGKNPGGVFIINLVLGWSVLGWVIALVMACGQTERRVYGPREGGLVQAIAARREPRL